MSELRRLIEEMVLRLEKDTESTFIERLGKVPEWLKEIERVVPHTISLHQSTTPLQKYNCIMHALGLVERMTEYPHPLWVARTEFVRHLIDAEVLRQCEPQAGALVTWSSMGQLKHIGKLIAPDRAISKWGDSILCSHGLEEIPLRYGDVSGFYHALDPENVSDHLHRYVFGVGPSA